MHSQNKVH